MTGKDWAAQELATRFAQFRGQGLTVQVRRSMEAVVRELLRELFAEGKGIPGLHRLTPRIEIRSLNSVEEGRLLRTGHKLQVRVAFAEMSGVRTVEVSL